MGVLNPLSQQKLQTAGVKMRKKTLEETIAEFREVHGDRYDYSKVEYVNNQTKVLIICPEHGQFFQAPHSHKKNRGCPICGGRMGLSKKEVIEDFQKVHGEYYDYSKVEYKNTLTKVRIICPEHGEFWQRPCEHKRGAKCRECSNSERPKTTKEVIKEFYKIHGDRYDYSKVEYTMNKDKVLIICPEHGEFWQRPTSHKTGIGCPECGKNQISEPLFRECLETFISRFGKFEFPNTRPDWLRNPETNRRLELDCYNEELGLAFELQGIQHYKPIKHWGGEKKFARIIRRDVHKRTECTKHGVELFRIDNRPVSDKSPDIKKKYYEKQIRKCLNKAPKDIKVKLLNANKKEKA